MSGSSIYSTLDLTHCRAHELCRCVIHHISSYALRTHSNLQCVACGCMCPNGACGVRSGWPPLSGHGRSHAEGRACLHSPYDNDKSTEPVHSSGSFLRRSRQLTFRLQSVPGIVQQLEGSCWSTFSITCSISASHTVLCDFVPLRQVCDSMSCDTQQAPAKSFSWEL